MNLKANSQTADSVSKFQNLRFSGEHQEFDDSKSYIYQLTQIFGEIFGKEGFHSIGDDTGKYGCLVQRRSRADRCRTAKYTE